MTRTKRRRVLWCAWWTGEPTESPFRPPDAWGGGARTEGEAHRLAERAARTTLQEIEGRWAAGWVRLQRGQSAFVERPARPEGVSAVRPAGPHDLLGVPPGASLEQLRAAFRRQALEHHPDRGGDPSVFIAMKAAYDRLVNRAGRRRS